MSILVVCTSCASRLKVGEQMLGKKIRCPMCSKVVLAQEAKAAPVKPQREERVQERPAAPQRLVKKDAVMVSESRPKPPPLTEVEEPARQSRPKDEEPPEMDVEETQDPDDPPPKQSSKKKKKKKKDQRILEERTRSREIPAWVLWTFGGGGVAATMFILLSLALLSRPDSNMRFWATYLFIMTPVSTVIFFVAMYLSSVLFEALEIGEIHVAFFKAFLLVFLVNIVSLIPGGWVLTLVVWLVGLFTIFRLDLWEARVVLFMNWVLNIGASALLFAFFLSGMMHGASAWDNDGPDLANPPAKMRPGNFQINPALPDDDDN